MIVEQDAGLNHRPDVRWYAACPNPSCGVCGPLRRSEATAGADDRAHEKVCAARGRR